jgi:hypothetical protein
LPGGIASWSGTTQAHRRAAPPERLRQTRRSPPDNREATDRARNDPSDKTYRNAYRACWPNDP